MPLHLLGKKSWNVYNADNIARVQRDEAAAAAEEHAAEQRMQDADAARRLAILRGETPPPLPEPEEPADPSDRKHARRDGGTLGGQRKRKRAGEDDTEFEMRVARERAEEGARVADELGPKRQKLEGTKREGDVSIVDSRGHIDLVGPPPRNSGAGGGDEGKKTHEPVEKHTKSFGNEDFTAKPWYEDGKRRHAADRESCFDREAERCVEAPTTNVWGRDDSKRRGRETARLDASDPLAAMKSGARKVRDIQKERRRDGEERRRELEQLRQDERRREKRRKREQERAAEDKDEDERRRERRRKREHGRADEGQDEGENRDRPLQESHRSGRSERRHHDGERHEGRRAHAHREEHRRPREDERARDRGSDRHHERRGERSRERGTSSRSHHRDKDRDDRRRDRRREN